MHTFCWLYLSLPHTYVFQCLIKDLGGFYIFMGLLLSWGYKLSPWQYENWMLVKRNAKCPKAKLRALHFYVVYRAGCIQFTLPLSLVVSVPVQQGRWSDIAIAPYVKMSKICECFLNCLWIASDIIHSDGTGAFAARKVSNKFYPKQYLICSEIAAANSSEPFV